MATRRVVVTGLGCVTPLGVGVEVSFERMLRGESGIAPITAFDGAAFPTRIAGECSDFKVHASYPVVESKKLDRFTQFALVATDEALKNARLKESKYDSTRVGVLIGSGIGGLNEIERMDRVLIERGPDRISPFFIP